MSSPTESEGVLANLDSSLIMSRQDTQSETGPNPPEDIINTMFDDSVNNLTLDNFVENKEDCNLTETMNSGTGDIINKSTENKTVGSKGAVNLTEEITDSIIKSNEVVFIVFYVSWCKFNRECLSSFNAAADQIKFEFSQAGQIIMGMVDCDKEKSLAERFHTCCNPQFILIRNGLQEKRNYNGNRSVDSFVEYIRKEMENVVKEFKDINDLGTLDPEKRMYIGYFDSINDPEYDIFRRAASNLKHYCQFRAGFGEVVGKMHPPGQPIVALRPDVTLSNEGDEIFKGSLLNFDELYEWMCGNYVPLVRRTPITRQNEHDFKVEHLPMVVLFHKPGDEISIRQFTDFCELHFMDLKNKILFLTSKDEKYRTRLFFFDKYPVEIPLILYMSNDFGMFLFDDFQNMKDPDKLKHFVQDRFFKTPRESEAVLKLTHETIDSVIESNEVVFIMFYNNASFNSLFTDVPMLNEVAEIIKSEYPREGQIAFGKVDIYKEESLARKYNVHGYPAFVTIRCGRHMTQGFKGKRSVKRIVDNIKKELEFNIKEIEDIETDIGCFDKRKRMYIGYFDSKDSPEYEVFRHASSFYKDYCEFRAGYGEVVVGGQPSGQATLVLRPDVTLSSEHDETFNGSLLNFNEVVDWMSENYVPLVRKIPITNENYMDYYYEDLPMLVLFHKAGDEEIVKKYTNACESNLMQLKKKLLIFTSDDENFAIQLLSKQIKPELPYIGIVDRSCDEVEVFSNIQEMDVPGKLENFILNSFNYIGFGMFD